MSTMQSAVGQSLADRLTALRRLRGPAIPNFTAQVRDVLLIASSSRSGSSMLAEMLRQSPALLHLRAELNPFLRLAGLAFPDSGTGSDRLGADDLHRLSPAAGQLLDEELALDVGNLSAVIDDDQFLADAAWRFCIQWPDLDFELSQWWTIAAGALSTLRAEQGWGPGRLGSARLFHLRLFDALRRRGWPVSVRYYDLPGTHDGRLSDGAPGNVLVEEPPFVLTQGWQRATEADLRSKPLVIKTPSNAYRLEFLRALFPAARIRVIHLTRNPAAAVNGLYDGWRYPAFHAHQVPEPLRISGYADVCQADRRWWKFDLPPGWEEYAAAPLEQVCAFQWRSCHQAILADLDGVAYLRLPFEDLIADERSRTAALARLCEWAHVTFDPQLRAVARHGLRPLFATARPAAGRWRSRAEIIRPALDRTVRAVSTELGYGSEEYWL